MKTTNVTEKAFAGNPHAWFDEGEVASAAKASTGTTCRTFRANGLCAAAV